MMELDLSEAERDREQVLRLRASLVTDQDITVFSHLLIRDNVGRQQLRELLLGAGFQIEQREISQWPLTWEIIVTSYHQADPDIVIQLRELLEQLAALTGAHYAGWQAVAGQQQFVAS